MVGDSVATRNRVHSQGCLGLFLRGVLLTPEDFSAPRSKSSVKVGRRVCKAREGPDEGKGGRSVFGCRWSCDLGGRRGARLADDMMQWFVLEIED
jgi:hypothetical protein